MGAYSFLVLQNETINHIKIWRKERKKRYNGIYLEIIAPSDWEKLVGRKQKCMHISGIWKIENLNVGGIRDIHDKVEE